MNDKSVSMNKEKRLGYIEIALYCGFEQHRFVYN